MGKGKIRRMRKKSGGKGSQIVAPDPVTELAKTASGRKLQETVSKPIPLPCPQNVEEPSNHSSSQTSGQIRGLLSYQTSNQDLNELRSQLLFDIRKKSVKDFELTNESASHQPIKQTSSTGNRFDLNQNENVNQIKDQLLSQINNQDTKCKHDFSFVQDDTPAIKQGKGRKEISTTVKFNQNVHQIKDKLFSQTKKQASKQTDIQDTTPSQDKIKKGTSRNSPNQQETPISSKNWGKCTKKASNVSNVRDQMLNHIKNRPERKEHNFKSVKPTLSQPLAQPETISPNLLLTSNQHFSQHSAPLPVGPIVLREPIETSAQSELIQHFVVIPNDSPKGASTEIYFKGSGFNGSSGDGSDEEPGLLEEDVSSSEASTIVVSEENDDKDVEVEVAKLNKEENNSEMSLHNKSLTTLSQQGSCVKCPPGETTLHRLAACRSCPEEQPKETNPRVCTRDICSQSPRGNGSSPPSERFSSPPLAASPPSQVVLPLPFWQTMSFEDAVVLNTSNTTPKETNPRVCSSPPEICLPHPPNPQRTSPPLQVVSPLPFWQTMSFKDAVVLDTSVASPLDNPRTQKLDEPPLIQQETEFQYGLPTTPTIPAFQRGRRDSPALPPPPTELELYGHEYEGDEADRNVTLPLQVVSCEWGTTFSAPIEVDTFINFEETPAPPMSFSEELDEALQQAGLTKLKVV